MSPQEFLRNHDWLSPGSIVTVMTDYVTAPRGGGRKLLLPGTTVTVLDVIVDDDDRPAFSWVDEFRIGLLTQEGLVVETLASRDFIAGLPAHELWAIDYVDKSYEEFCVKTRS